MEQQLANAHQVAAHHLWEGFPDRTGFSATNAFLAPLSTLRDPASKRWQKVTGSKLKMPVYSGCEHKVWGLTAYILHQLLDEIDANV